jgi:AraC-like DNA-binding protein
MNTPVSVIPGGVITKLIENCTAYSFDRSELCLYETFERCEKQPLVFHNPVIVSMISGKKVMHVEGRNPFQFFPGQTLVFAPNRPMVIDFPDASVDNPARCLTLEIEARNVEEMMGMLNEVNPKPDGACSLTPQNIFQSDNQEVVQSLQRLRERTKSVTDICYELGYSHLSYFVRQFKKYEGITPKQYQVQLEQRAMR